MFNEKIFNALCDALETINPIIEGIDDETLTGCLKKNKMFFGTVHYASGACKGVFLIKGDEYVYKINFTHNGTIDYNKREADNYEKAEAIGIEKILLKTEYFKTLDNGIVIYRQKKYSKSYAECPSDYRDKMLNKCKNLAKRRSNRGYSKVYYKPIVKKVTDGFYWTRLPNEWVARAIQIYGKAFMKQVEKWTQDNEINDLHSGNVGFIGKQPVIFDYAGYVN